MNEAEFILELQGRQMQAKSGSDALYWRMHKELAPQLLTMLESSLAERDAEARKTALADFLDAYSRFTAATIDGVVNILGRRQEPNMRKVFAELILEGIELYLRQSLETPDRPLTSEKGNESTAPNTP